jgi:cyclopropane-fatty-acyl-phospholipid synthase
MNSLIYQGEVSHARLTPVRHSFHYPVYFYAFDLDELAQFARKNQLFGYNQLRPVAIHDRDYLQPDSRPLRQKLEQTLSDLGMSEPIGRVMLVTTARYFNYVFNPVSFFYCYSGSGELLCVLAQVNNTFGEMHLYLLKDAAVEKVDGRLQFQNAKQFHVSPFFSSDGIYHFQLTEPQQHLDNRIHYHQAEQLVLIARIHGKGQPLNGRSLLLTIIKHPLSASLTMPRILWQAARLYWQRRLPVFTKPIPDHQMTIRPVPPSLLDRLGRNFVCKHFSRLQQDALEMQLPEKERYLFGQPSIQAKQLKVCENRFFRRVMLAGEIGFGEAYTDGEWTTNDLPGLLTMLAAHAELIDDRSTITTVLGRCLNFLRHMVRTNTIRGSARNIREHYDLSNEFFAIFLDPSMTYSSALFDSADQSLDQAQLNKLRTIIAKAEIKADERILEIGCGWGSFAIEAVRQTGCRVTGITLSQEQLTLARERVREAGLEDRIDLHLCDYRHVTGQYDKIVSIEMLEAVGHAGLKTFFRACDQSLRPGGKAVIQVITIPDRKYKAYRYSSDWIRKHIFPGGHLPSIGAICNAMAVSSFNLNQLHDYGFDYARTIDLWRQTLLDRKQQVLKLGYDENFLRKWEYYFAYCQAGFASRIINLTQMVLDKPGRVERV